MSYIDDRRKRKNGEAPPLFFKKDLKPIKKISDKKKQQPKDLSMDEFFTAMRKRMTGTCQCGCGQKSSRNEDDHFRASISHIFPKRIFKSIATHELNWVERNFWDGCHSNMDNRSMDLWPNFADWDDIKEKVLRLIPFIPESERKNKFYSKLTELTKL